MFDINISKLVKKTNILTKDECWIYNGYLDRDGYGIFDGYRTHRIAYFLRNGTFDPTMFVLHNCDIRNCINPDHLYLGTHLDNMKDRYDRNRVAIGEKNGWALLSDNDVINILELVIDGQFTKIEQISEYFGCSNHPIYRIFLGQNWTHITNKYDIKHLREKIIISGNPKLTKLDVIDIKLRLKNGQRPMYIYQDYSDLISSYTIYDIKNGRSWKNFKFKIKI